MNILDVILIICFIPPVIKGFAKGFISQAAGLLALVIGVWLSFKFTNLICDWLSLYIHASKTILYIIAFVLILGIVYMGFLLLGRLLRAGIKIILLGWLDKLLGLLFAAFKVSLVLGLLIILFNTLNTKFNLVNADILNNSLLYNPLKNFAYTIFPYLKLFLFK
ncbi:MAG: CvpA family protein [Bacteroidales bacterium]|jgi:membrane protein required for colicin V production|nr:CvpA family protein [Bacteroidales bacterium]MCI1784567.1 CvpA family protein [Bacteroidales bacterium]